MDFADRQTALPLLDALYASAERTNAAFHTPGHKRGQGISSALAEVLGAAVFRADLPELPELDNLFAPEGVIEQAQGLASEAFGADRTWFLANGSTCGIEAAILATCHPGDTLVLPRNAHQSAIAALILSGAMPVFVAPDYDSTWDMAYSLPPERVAVALEQHPDAKAVLLVSPTYHGICSNVAAIAQIAHQRNIPLLVDEAHGAHFSFHPDLPPSALAAGADLAVQSTHKVLSALTQAAMLHVRGTRIDCDRLSQALQLVQSTSPSYLLLASLDAARQQMATQGKALLDQTLELAEIARTQISQIPGLSVLSVLSPEQASVTAGFAALDPTRLTVDITRLGITGFEADAILHQTLGVTAELPSLRHLTFIISLGNKLADIDRLVQAFKTLVAKNQRAAALGSVEPSTTAPILPNLPSSEALLRQFTASSAALSPRDAFFAPTVPVTIDRAVDRVSAELVCPYPPGIPVLFPGELITLEAIEYLQQVIKAGGIITGCSDPMLHSLKVVRE
jgi:arginine/lysine/ornithine decarboxylase